MSNQRDAASREKAFREIHGGKTYAKKKKKHGTRVANRQAVAIYFSKKRRGELKAKRKAARKR